MNEKNLHILSIDILLSIAIELAVAYKIDANFIERKTYKIHIKEQDSIPELYVDIDYKEDIIVTKKELINVINTLIKIAA